VFLLQVVERSRHLNTRSGTSQGERARPGWLLPLSVRTVLLESQGRPSLG